MTVVDGDNLWRTLLINGGLEKVEKEYTYCRNYQGDKSKV